MKLTNKYTEVKIAAPKEQEPVLHNEGGVKRYRLKNRIGPGELHRLDGPAVENSLYNRRYPDTPVPEHYVKNQGYSKEDYPEAVRQYLVESLHLPDMPFFALQDYLDELYSSYPDFRFEGKSYEDLAEMIRKYYRNQ